MNEYLFRFPENTPELTFDTLRTAIDKQGCALKIGTTVQVWEDARGGVAVQLYDIVIARVSADCVEFGSTDDPHMATTAWLSRIVADNGIGNGVGRVRRHKADGPGPEMSRGRAGLLVIDWERSQPVTGHTYPVNRERIEANRANAARWAEMIEHYRERSNA